MGVKHYFQKIVINKVNIKIKSILNYFRLIDFTQQYITDFRNYKQIFK